MRVLVRITLISIGVLITSCSSMPDDWPIHQLKMPPGSHRLWSETSTLTGWRCYDLGFRNKMDSSAVIAHTERCLKPLGYLKLEGTNSTYFSPDGVFRVEYGWEPTDVSADIHCYIVRVYSSPPEEFKDAKLF